jgi:hypothetical protein
LRNAGCLTAETGNAGAAEGALADATFAAALFAPSVFGVEGVCYAPFVAVASTSETANARKCVQRFMRKDSCL